MAEQKIGVVLFMRTIYPLVNHSLCHNDPDNSQIKNVKKIDTAIELKY